MSDFMAYHLINGKWRLKFVEREDNIFEGKVNDLKPEFKE